MIDLPQPVFPLKVKTKFPRPHKTADDVFILIFILSNNGKIKTYWGYWDTNNNLMCLVHV
jgi:hypothetical protein